MTASAIMTGVATGMEAAEGPGPDFDVGTAFTMSLWVRIDSRLSYAEIFGRSVNNNQQPEPCLADENNGKICTQSQGTLTEFTGQPTLGAWTFVAMTWDGGIAGVGGTLKSYAGTTAGNLTLLDSHTDTLTDNGFTAKFIYFGRGAKYNGSGHSSISGRMSAGKAWVARVLTLAQLKVELPVWNMQDKTSKYCCLPMKTDFNDNSGAGNHFSNIGSIAFSADTPPITDDPVAAGGPAGFFGVCQRMHREATALFKRKIHPVALPVGYRRRASRLLVPA